MAEPPISSPNTDKTLITVATYNEAENIPKLIEEILSIVPDVDILVIDDNSPDGTGRWCDENMVNEPRLSCLHRQSKLGLGTAVMAGMKWAIQNGYKQMLNMDADFSHHPRYLPDIIAGMDPKDGPVVDVMIGSRYVPGGGVEGWPLKRRLMSLGLNIFARTLLGLKCKDCSGSFRCYRTSFLEKVNFAALRSPGYSFLEEILWHLRRAGARFGETPIVFVNREFGTSKINSKEAVSALWTILSLGFRNVLGR